MKKQYWNDSREGAEPVVIVEFHELPDLWLTKDQYVSEGKFKGLLRSQCLCIGWIKKVHHLLKHSSQFPTAAWEG